MASRTKKSVYNIAMNFANQIVILVLGFVSRTIFIRTLGVEYLGINGLFTDVLGMLSLADLGFNTAMVYSLYRPLALNDKQKIAALMGFYKQVYNIIAISITVIGLALIPFLRVIIHTDKDIPLLEVYYLFALSGVIISYLFVYKTAIITADQKNYIVTRITIITSIIKTLTQILSLYLYPSFIVYLMIGTIFNFLNNLIASRKAVALYPNISEQAVLSKEERSNIFNNIKSVFIYKLSSVALNATDNILISIIVSTAMVGYYSNYLMVSNKIVLIISLLFTSLTASIGNIIVKESAQKRYEVFKAEQSVSNIISGVVVPCFFVLINDLIKVWLGKEYIISTELAVAMSVNLYLSCVLQPLWSYREATGMYQKTRWVMLIAAIINIILSVILGYIMGIVGIIAASAIARISTYVWFEPKLLFKTYFEHSSKSFFSDVLVNACIVFILSIMLFFSVYKIEINSWYQLIIKACICFILSFFVVIAFYSKSQGFRVVLNKIHKKHK